tara:strand:- start:870 stop:1274 length:405 start_codon:yes stop_codon:yes gene_type:complete
MNLNYKLFNLLPYDLINYIKNYLTIKQKGFTKVSNWQQYYKSKINDEMKKRCWRGQSTYIRFIITNKLSFIFENYILLIDKRIVCKWKKNVYKYKKKKYKNYILFLKWYSRKNNSIKCLNLILALENDIKNRRI